MYVHLYAGMSTCACVLRLAEGNGYILVYQSPYSLSVRISFNLGLTFLQICRKTASLSNQLVSAHLRAAIYKLVIWGIGTWTSVLMIGTFLNYGMLHEFARHLCKEPFLCLVPILVSVVLKQVLLALLKRIESSITELNVWLLSCGNFHFKYF